MFGTDELVVYGSEGVCRIIDIVKQKLGADEMEYYVLEPTKGVKSTIFVPTSSAALTKKMRRVMTKDELNEFILSFPEIDETWIDNDSGRKQKYREIIAGGDKISLVSMIKAIRRQETERLKIGKKLHASDERFVNDAETLLWDEFSLILGIDVRNVKDYVLGVLGLN